MRMRGRRKGKRRQGRGRRKSDFAVVHLCVSIFFIFFRFNTVHYNYSLYNMLNFVILTKLFKQS